MMEFEYHNISHKSLLKCVSRDGYTSYQLGMGKHLHSKLKPCYVSELQNVHRFLSSNTEELYCHVGIPNEVCFLLL